MLPFFDCIMRCTKLSFCVSLQSDLTAVHGFDLFFSISFARVWCVNFLHRDNDADDELFCIAMFFLDQWSCDRAVDFPFHGQCSLFLNFPFYHWRLALIDHYHSFKISFWLLKFSELILFRGFVSRSSMDISWMAAFIPNQLRKIIKIFYFSSDLVYLIF